MGRKVLQDRDELSQQNSLENRNEKNELMRQEDRILDALRRKSAEVVILRARWKMPVQRLLLQIGYRFC